MGKAFVSISVHGGTKLEFQTSESGVSWLVLEDPRGEELATIFVKGGKAGARELLTSALKSVDATGEAS